MSANTSPPASALQRPAGSYGAAAVVPKMDTGVHPTPGHNLMAGFTGLATYGDNNIGGWR